MRAEDYGILNQDVIFPQSGRIACQGIAGANSQVAAQRMFPYGKQLFFKNFEGVVEAVKSGLADFGVLPIENNIHGSVRTVYSLLQNGDVTIVRGERIHIHHDLLVKPGVRLADITEIYSHEQASGQCSHFLKSLGDKVRITPVLNTAIAAREVAGMPAGACAIANAVCAGLYGLENLDIDIQDSDNNYTRFVCIARQKAVYPGSNRISLMLSLPHQPGSLYHVLQGFAELNVDVIKLESVPIPGRDFEFLFYIDLTASVTDPAVREVLDDMEKTCPRYLYLGNYLEN